MCMGQMATGNKCKRDGDRTTRSIWESMLDHSEVIVYEKLTPTILSFKVKNTNIRTLLQTPHKNV